MKVAIAGAGITGAYLFRMLENQGCEVHLYDRRKNTGCGLTPCAWGTSTDFIELVSNAGLDGNKYILQRLDHLQMDEIRVRAELLTIDKPRLIKDLLRDTSPNLAPLPFADYDRVIDATGVARALLPPVADDLVLNCRQGLVQSDQALPNRIKLGGIGYAWCFPLDDNRYHIGCGNLLHDPGQFLEQLGWIDHLSASGTGRVLCRCDGGIRLTGPHLSQPFVTKRFETEIWGIGEAIGCVASLAGDGIVPGLRSVQLLLAAWHDPTQYRQAVLDEFHWMREERAIIERLRQGQGVGLRQARVLRKNSQRMGMTVGLRHAITLLRRMGNAAGSSVWGSGG
ncbi:MAG: hypothetical protein AB7D06_00160 [Pedobacter sp.]